MGPNIFGWGGKKTPQESYFEYDKDGRKVAHVSYTVHGKKVRVDLKKKRARALKAGKIPMFMIDDRRSASVGELLKEIYQYRYSLGSVPPELKTELVSRFDRSLQIVDLAFIGGEGIVFAVVDMAHKKLALKIALPFELAPGKRTIEEIQDGEENDHHKSVLIQEINEFRERFAAGARLQDEFAEHLIENGVTRFGVPTAKLSNDPCLHIIMPWVPGKTILDRDNRELLYSLGLYVRILEAVEYMHDFGMVHRDIKAANIMIARRGSNRDCIYLIDWTLAKRPGDQDRDLTCPGVRIGTPGIASPKQFGMSSAVYATEVDDIYSLGVMLYELIYCKKRPAMALQSWGDMEKIARYLEEMSQTIPEVLRPVFLKATEIDETKRYQRVKYMLEDFEKALKSMDGDTAVEFVDIRANASDGIDIAEASPFEMAEDEGEAVEIVLKDFDCEACGLSCGEFAICELVRRVILEGFRLSVEGDGGEVRQNEE